MERRSLYQYLFMDFIANIIKRPLSVGSSGSPHAAAMEAAQAPSDVTPRAGDPLRSTDLGALLDSASEDLLFLEEQHSNLLLEPLAIPMASPTTPPTSSRESIQKLLSEINVNLNQVSANEMEHLQAMSGEVCPRKTKTDPCVVVLWVECVENFIFFFFLIYFCALCLDRKIFPSFILFFILFLNVLILYNLFSLPPPPENIYSYIFVILLFGYCVSDKYFGFCGSCDMIS